MTEECGSLPTDDRASLRKKLIAARLAMEQIESLAGWITEDQVRRYFGEGLDYLLTGGLGTAGRPTCIRDLISGQFIRD